MQIKDATHIEEFLIGQIDGTVRFSMEAPATKLSAIARFIKEYDVERMRRIAEATDPQTERLSGVEAALEGEGQ